MPSKLEQLQQKYRRQLLQEKEERMIKIHTESQQKALSKVARYTNHVSSVPTASPKPHQSPVKKGSPGVDRSRPLPPISKDGSRSSNSADYNNSKVPCANSRSKSVDSVDGRHIPQRGPLAERVNQQSFYGPARNGCTRVSETSYEFEASHQVVETTKTSQHVEVMPTKPASEAKAVDPKPAQPERKPDQETIARLKQAELQRLRAKIREEPQTPRQNGISSDTVTRSSTVQKKAVAKPAASTTPRSKASFLNATASSIRKAVVPDSKPVGRSAARANQGHKPPGPGQEQCRICGRNFNTDRIEKHSTICAKAAQKKVKVFDATKMRVKGTEAEQFVKKGTLPKSEPKTKQSDWRKKHNEFIEAIRQAKVVQQHLARGGKVSDLPPPPPSDTSDYVQCPYCSRKFNEGVAQRHIPKCKNILSNKKNPLPKRK